MRFASPLRYPGGKASLSSFLAAVIGKNGLRGGIYYEPYVGGAGAALTLLRDEVVSEIFINDADDRVNAFWQSILGESDRFVDKILSVPINMAEWRRQKKICENPSGHTIFEVGFSAFYMNRCNRSGVLTGAGPIGGYEQKGRWKIGVRFNREPLAERIINVASMKDKIHLSHLDAIDFLKTALPRGRSRSQAFVYLDPPYVHKGQRLYLNAYEKKDHLLLAKYLKTQNKLNWIMSYDETNLVRRLYSDFQVTSLPILYSLQEKRFATELIIAPSRVSLPSVCNVRGQQTVLSLVGQMQN